jgi:hypothetical protein
MPKRISKKKPEPDANQTAFRVLSEATQDKPAAEPTALAATISQVMADMGRKGGKIGGKRRLETMSAKERKDRASQAANARWKATKKPQ